jgi:hypothetical protein
MSTPPSLLSFFSALLSHPPRIPVHGLLRVRAHISPASPYSPQTPHSPQTPLTTAHMSTTSDCVAPHPSVPLFGLHPAQPNQPRSIHTSQLIHTADAPHRGVALFNTASHAHTHTHVYDYRLTVRVAPPPLALWCALPARFSLHRVAPQHGQRLQATRSDGVTARPRALDRHGLPPP